MTLPCAPFSPLRPLQAMGLSLAFLGGLGCGGGAEKVAPPPTPPAQTAPVITSFTASPTTVPSGTPSTLTWVVTGATTLSIDKGIGVVTGTSHAVTPSLTTTYTLTATNGIGSTTQQASVTVTSTADTQAPTVPTNLATSNVTATGLTLTWTASADNVGVTGYRVFRNGTQVGTPATTTFAQAGLNPGTTYSYTVAAQDAAGNVSAQSAARSVTTAPLGADTQAPSIPSGLSASCVNATHLMLSWVPSTDNVGVAGYRIFRNGAQVGTSATNQYKDTGLTASTRYNFTVVAFDAAGNASAQSAVKSQTTASSDDATPPTVPTNLTAIEIQATSLILTWTASTDANYIQRYYIHRNGVLVGDAGQPHFGDAGLTASTAYTYTVTAEDTRGNISQASAPKTVTTPISPPALGSFAATRRTVTQGQATTLSWTVTGATSLTLEPGVGAVSGTSRTLSPAATTTYALTATNAGGSVTRRLIIRVNKPGETLDDSDGPFTIIEP